MSDYHAAKHDQGKKRYDLIPEICVREIMRRSSKYSWAETFYGIAKNCCLDRFDAVLNVLNYGLEKYKKEGSWQEVPNAQNRYSAAYLRHIEQHNLIYEKNWSEPLRKEEDLICDEESGLPHLSHALCNVMFLLWFEIKEDRPELFKS